METAIVIAVPEAELVVGNWRRQYTIDGAEGMPAHITLLYPFADTSMYTAGRGREIEDILRGCESIRVTFSATAYFQGQPTVLYLVPDPPAPFMAMTSALVAHFPEHPPYGGAHDEVIPHLTVAEHDDLDVLSRIEDELADQLPIQAMASEAQLMQKTPGGWRVRRTFAVGKR